LAKLEAELGSEIIYVPKKDSFYVQRGGQVKATVSKSEPVSTKVPFQDVVKKNFEITESPKAA
jgi:hypothetical protein